MMYLSALSFIASVLYFYEGYNAYHLNKKSKLCRIFFILTISMTIWSFAGGFIYLAVDIYQYSFWNKLSAFGWCTFEAIALHFVMVLTGNKNMRLWYIKLIVYTPAVIFLIMVLFLFGPEINTPLLTQNIFYIGNFLYNFSYLLASIILVVVWGMKSQSRIIKVQVRIIAISSVIPFILNLVIQDIMPLVGLPKLPYMGQLFMLIMLWGVNNSIFKYQFMSIPTTKITNELFHELKGLTFLLDARGFVIKSNRNVSALLRREVEEAAGCHITKLICHPEFCLLMKNCESIYEPVKIRNILLPSETGSLHPFHISVVPLLSRSSLLQGFLIIGEDVSATEELHQEIRKHKKTNDKLANSEKLFRTVLEVTPVPIILTSKRSSLIIYMNTQAQELLLEDRIELIGRNISEFFLNQEDREELVKSMTSGCNIYKKETALKRKDGSELLGTLTMIPSVYQEEEVSLFCIIDITTQRKIEETLKQNNESINKLNNELLMMNNILTNKSIKDSLTNLYNHQYINEVLERTLHNAIQKNTKLCVMMLDVDYFKQVNDRFGHQIGDKVLITISDIISNSVRKEDYVGRYGGEEFLVVLPDIDLETAIRIAERIRTEVQTFDFGVNELKTTISIGLVQHTGETSNALINNADMLLYRAKNNGRNRVEA